LGHYTLLISLTLLCWGAGSLVGPTVGGRSRGCFFWVLSKRSIPKPDLHGKDITHRESLGTDML